METNSMRCLTNSISRFIHLVSFHTSKAMPTKKEFESTAALLKLLKPVLDEISEDKIDPDDVLSKQCEELDATVNEAREYMERWSSKASRILSVLQSEPLLTKIRSSSLETCRLLCRLLRTSPSSSSLADVQVCAELMHCVQEFQCWQPDQISKHIDKIVCTRDEKLTANIPRLAEIIESLGLTSNQELLRESIAIEKERIKGGQEEINQALDFLSIIRDFMLKNGYFETLNGVPVPSYFRCPLSLVLMLDPVIIASGQTFERSSIQKWLDSGLTLCPKTRLYLSHSNVIPNYTVKALIANWVQEHHLKPHITTGNTNMNPQDIIRTDSFHCSAHSSNSASSEIQKIDEPSELGRSTEHSYTHSRTQSASSAISSSDYISGEITSERVTRSSSSIYQRTFSLLSSDSGCDGPTTSSRVEKLVEDLKSQSNEVQTAAAEELRLLAKHNMENRVLIAKYGAIGPLVSLLQSNSKPTQEHAVTALLNLSLNEQNKAKIAELGVIDPLIHVLKFGTDAAKENSAAALFSLSNLEEYRVKIGRSGAVKALVDLLGSGSVRGIKDAATALFNLSICHENKARIVQAGAVKRLVEFLEPSTGMVDKAVALLANLATTAEGRLAIAREGGIPLVVEIVESGSQRGRENAASILLQLCLNSNKFCTMVLQEGAVPPLVALSQSGTPRAKEKAQQLLSHFREQREGSKGKKK